MSLQIVILAAGLGKRMHSNKPKVLHKLAGKSLLEWVITAACSLRPETIHIVYGHGSDQIKESLVNSNIDCHLHWVWQEQQLGTGHAVMQVLPFMPLSSHVLIMCGDVPLIQCDTLANLTQCTKRHNVLTLLLATLHNPKGLGRILRDIKGYICDIVEEKDANDAQQQIKEIYAGICCVPVADLARWLPKLTNNNLQNEYYLTEIIRLAASERQMIQAITTNNHYEIQGVNDRVQLQLLERIWQQKQAIRLMQDGVTIADSARIDIRGQLCCGIDVFIDVNCVFIGNVYVADGCYIEPNCILTNVRIGKNSTILSNSVLENCHVGEFCQIGPFARLRPGTNLANSCKIGNFVETKNAQLADGCKANHLSYLGDVQIGKNVNIGAGTITCNFDGANKHQTIIEDDVFIGSGTQLIAPITIGAHATIGAGSTMRKNAPPGELTLTERKEKTVFGWHRPKKNDKTA
jgi:bifunctional UDP-N-acetylglucosamine pyrophosphorylase/glucosamine-1-phosphate N-acetyltransferase